MAGEILGKCPVCGSNTEVTRIYCGRCETAIEGHFQPCRFCKLTTEQKAFLDAFIKCRGNIKEVEKELGISYPTVKSRLEDVAGALGYKTEPDQYNSAKKKDILDRLNNGEITAEEAVTLLND